ncbi:glycosyltransferase domain-containing protein [Vibrio algarum]|uniref:DUF616 domain-containing protein n=1 Tax=Vibrio algarum TaxID=3020714 RepID=A0ABT4YQ75_9VIBR|nr:glycosyltransferase domain-containing protein [Vibrio sp. KJ40-1]MDB1123716.1 DUF616 domain-containing protein [Vibrio sp. KJ40-1]
MKKVVYTVISSGYDRLRAVPSPQRDIDFFVISDDNIDVPEGWKLIEKEKQKDPILFNRFYKINPYTLFTDYDYSIYIDSHLEVTSDLNPLFDDCIKSEKGIAMYDHPERDCAYEEAEKIKELGYAHYGLVNRQMNRYRAEGFNRLFLKQANIIFRSHEDNGVIHAMEIWWEEFINGARRDQLSFAYSCLKSGCDVLALGRHDAWYGNKYFKHHGHLRKNRSKNLKWKIINKLARLVKLDQ